METVNKIYKQESSKLFAGTYPRNAEIFSLPPSFARKSLTVWRIITRSSAHTFDHSPPPLPLPPRNLRTVCRPFNRRPYIVASSSFFFVSFSSLSLPLPLVLDKNLARGSSRADILGKGRERDLIYLVYLVRSSIE